ncbi:cytochrome P450 [Aspergillus campestris IBT 28561]|uniref:Cytochrome P450 n=1 Tax=Aspergillus campestris (strain IBT 28561) TaxID=1392248 RepID=A0A2I1DDE7_ASPC2|nr:cytochrome P450 [Aspergillus campestris IBT 28561]PKY07894.1 cytochrome P450 [Aspergillus campestris IBT 28561]
MKPSTIELPFAEGYESWASVMLLALAGCVLLMTYQAFFAIKYPADLPLAGEPGGKRTFSWRMRWRYYTDCEALYKETYENYTKHGKAVLLPGLGFRHDIILPQSAMRDIMARPEKELSHADAVLELVQLKYAFGHEKYKADPWPCMLVKSDINANLEAVCDGMNEELKYASERYIGCDTEAWKEVNLTETIRMVMMAAASRFTVGFPLCRNEEYLRACWKVNDGIVMNGGLTGATPRLLRPIFGPLVTINLRRSIEDVKKQVEPIYHQRLQALSRQNSAQKPDSEEPRDLFQQMLRYAQKERPNELHDFPSMTRRLCFANFAAVHQTTLLVTNMILNIVSSDAKYNTITVLRNEVDDIIGPDSNAKWTKYKVAQMIKSDSVARETMRLHSNTSCGVFRKVLVEGIKTEDGIELPKGAYVSFLGRPLQCKTEDFGDPIIYDPFRFSLIREKAPKDTKGRSSASNLSFVSTSPEHLPFGHGGHSCPGRFLVDVEVKMIVAYLLRNYDVEFPAEYNGQRPANRWMAETLMPPSGARIRVKRRS